MNNYENNEVKQESKSRFNVIDAIIILLILVCVFTILVRCGVLDNLFSNSKLEEYELTFTAKYLRHTDSNAFVNGDTFYEIDSGKLIGVFDKFDSISPASVYENDTDGSIIAVSLPESTKIDVVGVIACSGRLADDGRFLLNGTDFLAPGKVLTVRSEHIDVEITITAINAK